MAATTTNVDRGRDTARRYAPLAVLVTLALAMLLPSALNLPQANPSEVAEYAPVPPEDEQQDDVPPGNFSGLGLGGSSTLTASGDEGPGGEGAGDVGGDGSTRIVRGGRSQFKCVIVNGVARQTDDPLSPPCVPDYEGDNGGSTYKGVTGKDISVAIYIACSETNNNYAPTSRGQESADCGSMESADEPPQEDDFIYTRAIKRYAAYFNSRYQTYGRHVKINIFYGNFTVAVVGAGGCRDDCRRQDAATATQQFNPFAFLSFGGGPAFSEAVAKDDRLHFGDGGHPQSFYQRYPGLIWSYEPSLEEQAQIYASYVCRQVAGRPAAHSGNAGDVGKTRKFGLLYFENATNTFYRNLKDLVVAELRRCGVTGNIPQYTYDDWAAAASNPSLRPDKQTKLREMQNAGVTSVLWFGLPNGDWFNLADENSWYPEWIFYGDGAMEDFITARYANQDVYDHAFTVSPVTLVEAQQSQPCALALYDVDPSWPIADVSWACDFYASLRQVFTGIQVAGPDLTPKSMDQGYHAIPKVESTSAQVPACFYRPGDYTCVKDAIAMWWDPAGQIRGWTGEGCWRVTRKGKRSLAGGWPDAEASSQFNRAEDPCNGWTTNAAGSPNVYTG